MISAKRLLAVQYVLFLSVALIALYYFLVFQKLSDRAASLDSQLGRAWAKLTSTGRVAANAHGVDLAALKAQAVWLETLSQRLNAASQIISNRVAFAPAIQKQIGAPFQLVEFQNERQLCVEAVDEMAADKHVALDPAVTAGFPDYSAEMTQPELLWAQLALVHYVLDAAMRCQMPAINTLSVSPPTPAVSGETPLPYPDQLAVSLKLTGPALALSRYLLCLAVSGSEAKALGLPELLPDKPALFIDRLLVFKDSAQRPDSVAVELRVTALVYHQ